MSTTEPPTLLATRPPNGTAGPKQFAIVAAELNAALLKSALKRRRKTIIDDITRNRANIDESITTFVSWFASAGHECPLPSQLDRTLERGLSSISGPIDSLLYCEMTTGVLMGVQDLHAINGALRFDFAAAGEQFDGFRTSVICADGEPVVRDAKGIVASVFQGPDRRTSVTPGTTALLFYVFDSPGLTPDAFDGAVLAVTRLMHDAGSAPTEGRILLS